MRLAVLALLASLAAAQSTPPTFDVAAIYPTDMSKPREDCYMKGQPGGQTFTGRCFPLDQLIKYAYKIVDSQIVNAPDWITSDIYDFEAKTDHPVTRADVAQMFQQFLADRFQLRLHKEQRTMNAYVLTVDKSGNKMKSNSTTYEWEIPIQFLPSEVAKVKGSRCPLYYLSWWIGQRKNRPVVDQTHLNGFWDFTLEYASDNPTPDAPSGPNLVTALREQLGLKLEATKAPVDVYVIDHVEHASKN